MHLNNTTLPSFNLKGLFTHMHSLAFYVKATVSYTHNIALKNPEGPNLCFCLALCHLLSYFFLCIDYFSYLCVKFDDDVLPNFTFVLGDVSVHIRTG